MMNFIGCEVYFLRHNKIHQIRFSLAALSGSLILSIPPQISHAEVPSLSKLNLDTSTSPLSINQIDSDSGISSASQEAQDLQSATWDSRSVEDPTDASYLFGKVSAPLDLQSHRDEINKIKVSAPPNIVFSSLKSPGIDQPLTSRLFPSQIPPSLVAGFQGMSLLADAPNDVVDGDDDEQKWDPGRPDSHAPLGVMGDHTHSKGEVMLSYRYMRMEMSGNLDGTTRLTPEEVLTQFQVTPLRMTTEMHMFGAMYAPSNKLTLMVMAPYVFKRMDHLTRMGTNFTTRSQGFGDFRLSGLYKMLDQDHQRVHFNAGISFPTGSISERDTTPAGPNQVLPYPMQIGSGTFDLMPGITYLGQTGSWSWGAQGMGTIRLGRNAQNYRLGNQLSMTAWGAKKWSKSISTSLRLKGRILGNNTGEDPRLAPGNQLTPPLIPTVDPDLRGGSRVDLSVGINFLAHNGFLKGHRFAL